MLKKQRVIETNSILLFIDKYTSKIVPTTDSINTMALICALVLTIPYGIMSFINGDWFNELETKLSLCGHAADYRNNYVVMNNNIAVSIYASMINLMMVAFYYASGNSNLDGTETLSKKLRLKFMVLLMLATLICSIVGLMDVTSFLFTVYMNDDVCSISGTLEQDIWITGVTLILLTCPISIALSW